MYDDYTPIFRLQPVAHAGHDVWYEGEGRRMMVGKRIVIHTVIDLAVWVAGAFGTELPYCPVFAMFRVEKLYERVKGVSVGALRICTAGSRCGDD
jgi:hypothetical protein